MQEREIVCCRCAVPKAESLFHACKRNKNGKQNSCIECSRKEKAEYYRSEGGRLSREKQKVKFGVSCVTCATEHLGWPRRASLVYRDAWHT